MTLFDGSCTVLTAELTTPKSTAPKPVSTLVIPPITGSEKEKKFYSVRSSDNLIVHIFTRSSTGKELLGQRVCAARKSTKGRYFFASAVPLKVTKNKKLKFHPCKVRDFENSLSLFQKTFEIYLSKGEDFEPWAAHHRYFPTLPG